MIERENNFDEFMKIVDGQFPADVDRVHGARQDPEIVDLVAITIDENGGIFYQNYPRFVEVATGKHCITKHHSLMCLFQQVRADILEG